MHFWTFFLFNRFVFSDLLNKKDQKHLVIDFGGKFLKGGLHYSLLNNFSYLNKNDDCNSSNDCYLIPNSISAAVDDMMLYNQSKDAIKIGIEAFTKVSKSNLLGIQYFGAIFNRKRSFISSNCDFFNTDSNVTLSDLPLFWYLSQFFSKYQEKTLADDLVIILPAYTTDLTREEIEVANNNSFKKITFIKDSEIIQKVHSNLFQNNNGKNVLYLDFGAFSAKATVINQNNEIVSYDFNEECGIEKVAYRQSIKAQDNNKKKIDNHIFNARNEAYKFISSGDFYDEIFEKNLNDLIENSITNSNFVIDEFVLVGGGCQLPFVIKTVEKVSKGKFSLIDSFNKNINHLTFLADGYLLPSHNTTGIQFNYHPLFVKYNNQTHKIPGISIHNEKRFDDDYQFKINLGKIHHNDKVNQSSIWDSRIDIVTDKYHVLSGMSTTVLKLNISDLKSDPNFEGKFVQITGSFENDGEKRLNSFGLKFEVELCDVNEKSKEFVCKEKFNVRRSNSTVMKKLKAEKKASETDAAMMLIRALFDSFSKIKNGGKKDEL